MQADLPSETTNPISGIVTAWTDAGRKASGFNEKRDCTVRAFATVAGVDYATAHLARQKNGRKNRRGFVRFDARVPLVAKTLALPLKKVRRSGTLRGLLVDFPAGRLLVSVRRHAFAVVDGKVHDNDEQPAGRRIRGAWLNS